MSVRRGVTKTTFVARLVTEEKGPCAFCQRDVDDELIYGKLYAIGSIKCHYFCVLLSCCMVQKGRDQDGLFGFLYPDILAEIERSKKHKCSYCYKEGATLGCCVSQCRKQFHLPCGREKNVVSLFYGSYKSFCQVHTPKQKIAEDVMAKAKLRMQADRRKIKLDKLKEGQVTENSETSEPECICVICYEPVQGYPTIQTFWPPCCARDAWFHRSCVQRMALSAGMHYLKCPLCNDKENFYDAVVGQGYYVPDRDAAWELEQNAFADIYERPLRCDLEQCHCPMGREHDSDSGMWDIKLCLLCGSSGAHAHCLSDLGASRLLCALCKASGHADTLADVIEQVIAKEQEEIKRIEQRPIMPSRMSVRRTKQRIAYNSASSSRSQETVVKKENDASDTATSREELNLKSPKRVQPDATPTLTDIQNSASPNKLVQQLRACGVATDVWRRVSRSLHRPQPRSARVHAVSKILDDILNNQVKEKSKNKEPVKEWCSPKKCLEDTADTESEETFKSKSPKKALTLIFKSPSRSPKKRQAIYSPKTSPKKTEEVNNDVINNRTPSKTNFNNITINNDVGSDNTINNDTGNDNTINNDTVNDKAVSTDDDKADKMSVGDESSNSTFQLPPEFIADNSNSNDSLPIFETPKLKTVDMQKDSSLEISENDQVVKVDVVKMEETSPNSDFIRSLNLKSPVKNKKCAFKFSPLDNETLERDNVGFDLESFKNRYLNEVERDFKCKFKHNHRDLCEIPEMKSRLRTAIDFAMEASEDRKRSLNYSDNEDVPKKKQKVSDKEKAYKIKRKRRKQLRKKDYERSADIEVSNGGENVKLSLQKRKKKKGKVSIKNKEIKVKIQWKKKRVQVKISEGHVKKDIHKEKDSSKLKQYVLKYKDCNEPILEKPQYDVTPIKRKYIKQEKSPDNLKQTSIQSFFKVQVPKN